MVRVWRLNKQCSVKEFYKICKQKLREQRTLVWTVELLTWYHHLAVSSACTGGIRHLHNRRKIITWKTEQEMRVLFQ
jgi:hypothetical protein